MWSCGLFYDTESYCGLDGKVFTKVEHLFDQLRDKERHLTIEVISPPTCHHFDHHGNYKNNIGELKLQHK